MAVLEIPIITPAKEFSFEIDLDGNTVEFTLKWNITCRYWTYSLKGLSLTDQVDGAAIITGIDLLKPYAIRELGQLFCIDNMDLGQDPDFDNFGSRWSLIYVEKDTDIDTIV